MAVGVCVQVQMSPAAHRVVCVVPNALSALRLVLAVTFPLVPYDWRVWMVLLAGSSDFVDGYIARRFNAASWMGGLLDASADKLFVWMALATTVMSQSLQVWQIAVLVLRDLTVLGIVCYALVQRRWDAFGNMPARWFGKITTGAIFVLLVAIFARSPQPWNQQPPWLWVLFALAGIASVLAAMDYLLQFIRVLRLERSSP